jgi:hypothetical protein
MCGDRICEGEPCPTCRTELSPKEWPMCAPRYAATCTSIATQGARTFAECVTFAREVRELLFAQWIERIGRLSCFFAPRAECLICLCFSSARPPRTSRLLSCHRSVGVRRLAVRARPFAKLRSDKPRIRRPGSGFAADWLQATWGVVGGPHVDRASASRRIQDAGVAAVVPVRCRSGAGRRQADGLGRTW